MDRRAIGVYDSGLGGLCVLRVLQKMLPNENFIYFADTANLPYGNKSAEQIVSYSHRIITWMQNEMDVKLVVAACNTSSAFAIEQPSIKFAVPIIGTIHSIVSYILQSTHYNKIGVIATPSSCKSRAHEKALLQQGFQGQVFSISCPDFVTLIESNQMGSLLMKQRVQEYLACFKQLELDTLVYGCTHYPLIKNIIEDELPSTMQYIDPSEHIAWEAKKLIEKHEIRNDSQSTIEFYCSHEPEEFARKIFNLWGEVVRVSLPSVLY